MSKTIRAALLYFAIVLGTGFVLGMFRVTVLVPRIGARWAELAEMPIMAAVIFFAAGYLLQRYTEICSAGQSLVAGFLAVASSVAAELGLAVLLQDQSLAAFIAGLDNISGSVYVALLLVFGIMPKLQLASQRATMRIQGET